MNIGKRYCTQFTTPCFEKKIPSCMLLRVDIPNTCTAKNENISSCNNNLYTKQDIYERILMGNTLWCEYGSWHPIGTKIDPNIRHDLANNVWKFQTSTINRTLLRNPFQKFVWKLKLKINRVVVKQEVDIWLVKKKILLYIECLNK